ncbi:hypothetical protein PMAYCL1PPCAC_11406, partial [Pristionchus mayeri]
IRYTEQSLKYCDVTLQMKPLSRKMMHVMIEANAYKEGQLKKEDGLKVIQGEIQFHCKPGSITGKPGYIMKYEGRQEFSDARIFCSFTLETPVKISMLNEYNMEAPKIGITNDSYIQFDGI